MRQSSTVDAFIQRIKSIHALHHRAGDWFAEQGYVDEALHHYLAAGAIQTAVFLIEKIAVIS